MECRRAKLVELLSYCRKQLRFARDNTWTHSGRNLIRFQNVSSIMTVDTSNLGVASKQKQVCLQTYTLFLFCFLSTLYATSIKKVTRTFSQKKIPPEILVRIKYSPKKKYHHFLWHKLLQNYPNFSLRNERNS